MSLLPQSAPSIERGADPNVTKRVGDRFTGAPRLLPNSSANSQRESRLAGKSINLTNPFEPTIFHEHWWLDAASKGRYEAVEVTRGGKTVGRLPYVVQKRFGLASIEMPILTHFLGPALSEPEGTSNTVFLRKLEITRELIQRLPSVSLTRIKMHRTITDVVAFQEQEFRTSVQFTHEIAPQPEESLWSNLRGKTRNVIRRAQEQVDVRDLQNADQFMAFYARNLRLRRKRSFLELPLSIRLVNEAIQRGRGRILAAYDGSNSLLAANFYVWDQTSYYFLLTSRSPESRNGTTSLLLWEAIKEASVRGLIFDSDGLNSNGGILFLAGLGGEIAPRYVVSRARSGGVLLERLHDAVWGKNFFVRG
jgi:hypothetical protein